MNIKTLFVAVVLLLTACSKHVPVPQPPPPIVVSPLKTDCGWVTSSIIEGEPEDCQLLVAQFERGRKLFSTLGEKYAAAVVDDRIEELNLFRPKRIYVPGRRVPTIQLGESYVQGYVGPANFIAYAHPYVIFCECLHFFMWKFDPTDPRWEHIGHNDELDPLHFPCWQVIEKDWEEAHPQ